MLLHSNWRSIRRKYWNQIPRHKRIELWAKSIKHFGNFGRHFPATYPQTSPQHVSPCAAGDDLLKIVPCYRGNSNTRNGAHLRSQGAFLRPMGPFPEKLSHPKSCSKVSNLLTTCLFYPQILKTNRGCLYTRIFRRIQFSILKYWLTRNGCTGPKRFPGLWRTGTLVSIPDYGL